MVMTDLCGLVLPGGGIRGKADMVRLAALEQATGKQCYQMFGWMAGTSVGAINAIMLALGIPAEDGVRFYDVEGPEIFVPRRFAGIRVALGGPRFDIIRLQAALQRHFGDKVLGECLVRCMVTTTVYQGLLAKFWRSWDIRESGISVVDVATMSAAAPTFFGAFQYDGLDYCDGGVSRNNPASTLAIRMLEHNGFVAGQKIVVLNCPDHKSGFVPRYGGILDVVPHLSTMFIGAGENACTEDAETLLGLVGGSVLDIQVPLLMASHDIGNASLQNLRELQMCGEYRQTQDVRKIREFLRV